MRPPPPSRVASSLSFSRPAKAGVVVALALLALALALAATAPRSSSAEDPAPGLVGVHPTTEPPSEPPLEPPSRPAAPPLPAAATRAPVPWIPRARKWLGHVLGDDPRVLVVMIGQYRGGELAWRSFVANVLDSNPRAELALCATGSPPATLLERARFVWEVPEMEDWGALIDERCGSREWRARHCGNGHQYLGGVRGCGHPGSAGILLAYRELVARRIRELGLLAEFDAFVLTRTDYAYRCEHPPIWRLDRDAVWVRVGEEWGGYSDRHVLAFGAKFLEAIAVAGLVCDPDFMSAADLERRRGPEGEAAPTMNLETMQKLFWEARNLTVRQMDVPAFAVRTPSDPTSWVDGYRDAELDEANVNVTVKYLDELTHARGACGV